MLWLSGGVPCAYYIATAAVHGGFYEEGAFVAAAADLGVSHPPGAPLSSMAAALFALLPVGAIAFRAALASAVMAGLCLAAFAHALFDTLLGLGIRDGRRASSVALAGSWFLAQTPLFWEQAARPHVFAVQSLLAVMVLAALSRFEVEEPRGDPRVLYLGAFLQGMALANHPVLGLLTLPAVAPTLGRVFARRGFGGILGYLAAPLLGFSAYAYVPIRMGRLADAPMQDESVFARMLAMLGADPFWRLSYLEAGQTMAHFSAGLTAGHALTGMLLGLFALFGLSLALRSSNLRRFGLPWFLALLVPLWSSAWVIPARPEVDTQGVLVPSAMAVCVFAAASAAFVLEHWLSRGALLSRAIEGLLIALSALGLLAHAEARGHAHDVAPDVLNDFSFRDLPPRAALISQDPGTAFRLAGLQAETRLWRDFILVPLAFAAQPGAVDHWVRSHPELRELLRDYLLSAALPLSPLQSLAAARPSYLEPGPRVDESVYETLVGEGLWCRVLSEGTTLGDLEAAKARQMGRLARLYQRLGPASKRPPLGQKLAQTHLFQALLALHFGDREGARALLRMGLSKTAGSARLNALFTLLAKDAEIDVSAFLRGE